MWVKFKATEMVENQPVVRVQRDVTDPAEADAPGQGCNQEVN